MNLSTAFKSRHVNPVKLASIALRRMLPNPIVPVEPLPYPVTFLTPLTRKDLGTFPLTVESVQRFFVGEIREFLVVSPDDREVRRAALDLGCRWVCEDSVLSPAAKALVYEPRGRNRAGWIRQQLIKLRADAFVSTEHFITIDADTALVRPMSFWRGGKLTLFLSDEYHRPYFAPCRALLGSRCRFPYSFVSHCMIFDRMVLADLRREVGRRTGHGLEDAILVGLDPDEVSAFSEFELYGHFAVSRYASRHATVYWHNRIVPPGSDLDTLVGRHGRRCNTVSMHTYKSARATR